MDPSNYAMDEDGQEWAENAMFADAQFNEAFAIESPFGNSAFQDFTNMETYGESPGGLTMRGTSKLYSSAGAGMGLPHGLPGGLPGAADSPSQDSSSESSSHLKRKTTESPVSEPMMDATAARAMHEDIGMMHDVQPTRGLTQKFGQAPSHLSLEQGLSAFDFNSAASSPIQNNHMSLDAQLHMPAPAQAIRFNQAAPLETINPGMFSLTPDLNSGSASNLMFNQTSPNGMFANAGSQSPEAFNNAQGWNAGLGQNTGFGNDFTAQMASVGGLDMTPSPTIGATSGRQAMRRAKLVSGTSPLCIGPISPKSRVETQINVVMTLEEPPPGIEYLHLPLHTIAKSKLLAKEEYDKSKVLELHTMLVCTSAMHNPQYREKALEKARQQSNQEIQLRAQQARESDVDVNDPKNVDEADKPANGGEVRICSNCIQRERKRAGRKKTKREEEQQHWERFETERVVVFNSNEYLQFKLCEPATSIPDDRPYQPPEGAMMVTAHMRIACYCRHQSEKEGFRVIFTMKDQQGNVVAQQISDSILITDDHKTHPHNTPAGVTSEAFYQTPNFAAHAVPMASQSMVDIASHNTPFTASRSVGNLQALSFGNNFTANSHVHPAAGGAYSGSATPTAMASRSNSRPGSPSSAGQLGPNKKRKSSSNFHRKIPSGLMMTRVDTGQPSGHNVNAAGAQFSPTSAGMSGQMNPSMMSAQAGNTGGNPYFGSGPPTPSEASFATFGQAQIDNAFGINSKAYFSQPSSALPSRASSPVLHQTRGNMAAYARQPIQTSTNTIGVRPPFQAASSSLSDGMSPKPCPVLNSCIPDQGSAAGGNEVAILGENFAPGMQVWFGDTVAPVRFLSSNAMVATAPSSTHIGSVSVTITPPPGGAAAYPQLTTKSYRYMQSRDEVFIMALRQLHPEKQFGPNQWWEFARGLATKFLQSQVSPAGLQQGYPGTQR